MNTTQLQCMIRCDPALQQYILGVFSADRIPENLESFPCGFIVNTDNHLQPGSHWIAFFFPSRTTIEFFDSLGKQPSFYNIYFSNYLKKYTYSVINTRKIQSSLSNVCGLYCLFFLKQRLYHISMNKFINMFSANEYLNDDFIYNMMINIYPMCF